MKRRSNAVIHAAMLQSAIGTFSLRTSEKSSPSGGRTGAIETGRGYILLRGKRQPRDLGAARVGAACGTAISSEGAASARAVEAG